MRNLLKAQYKVLAEEGLCYTFSHPNARNRDYVTAFLKGLAVELHNNIPDKRRDFEYTRYGTWPINWYKRLKNAFARNGFDGVQEMLLVALSSYLRYGPIRKEQNGTTVFEHVRHVPQAHKAYFESLITLAGARLLPNRIPAEV